jgi:hypothetical protein
MASGKKRHRRKENGGKGRERKGAVIASRFSLASWVEFAKSSLRFVQSLGVQSTEQKGKSN